MNFAYRDRCPNPSRRVFVAAALGLPVAAAAPVAVAATAASQPPAAASSGYHVTAHVQTYYRLAARL